MLFILISYLIRYVLSSILCRLIIKYFLLINIFNSSSDYSISIPGTRTIYTYIHINPIMYVQTRSSTFGADAKKTDKQTIKFFLCLIIV